MKNIMKISILMLSLLVIVTGCGGSEKTNNVEPEKEKEVTFEEAMDAFTDMVEDEEEFTFEFVDHDYIYTLYFISDDSFALIVKEEGEKFTVYCNIDGESRFEYDGEEEYDEEDEDVEEFCGEDVSDLYTEFLDEIEMYLEDVNLDDYEEDGDKLVIEFEDENVTEMSITKDSKGFVAKGQSTNESFTFTIGKVKLPK